jgi:MscS family membrane protein
MVYILPFLSINLKEYAQETEIMWDNVLIPLLEGVIPVLIF